MHQSIFASSRTNRHWNCEGNWNPPHWRQRHYMGNTVIADDLVMQGTKASATMVLIQIFCRLLGPVMGFLVMILSCWTLWNPLSEVPHRVLVVNLLSTAIDFIRLFFCIKQSVLFGSRNDLICFNIYIGFSVFAIPRFIMPYYMWSMYDNTNVGMHFHCFFQIPVPLLLCKVLCVYVYIVCEWKANKYCYI